MLKTLRNAFKSEGLRRKILYTLMMLVVIRIGSQLPIPGINTEYFREWFAANAGDAFNFFNAITGGSFESMSILALSISPYITASIIIQLLTIAIPKLEEMQRDGEDGRKKIVSITRYTTVGLALVQASAMAIGFGRQGLFYDFNVLNVTTAIVCMTAGSAFLMWAGERITENGIGNGISIVLIINIISGMPNDFAGLFEQFVVSASSIGMAVLSAIIIVAVVALIVVAVVILNDGVRNIPVQYAKRIQGSKMVGGQASNIPLRVSTSGVIPVIFAQSILQLPVLIATFAGFSGTGFWSKILNGLSSSYWCNPAYPIYSIGMLVYMALIIGFSYFYTSVTFNPYMIADNLKRQGGVIPGIRPGKPTSDYLNTVLNRVVFTGAIGLMIIAIIPYIFSGIFNANVSFGGTSVIIVVSVILETLAQAKAMVYERNYKGFLSA